VYEGWLQAPQGQSTSCDARVLFSSNRGENVVGSGDKSVVPHSHDHDHHDDHHHEHYDHNDDSVHHDHDHGHSHRSEHSPHSSDAAHSHEDRVTVECRSVTTEGPERPGKVVGEALLRVIYKKGLSSPEVIRDTVGLLEAAGVQLKGADLVLKAWTDPAFKEQLLADGMY
jgi:hypothetical protein